MTDAEFAAVQARIKAVLDRWREPLGLERWELHHEYYREGFPASDDAARDGTVMRVTARWEYRDARLEINALAATDLGDEALDEIVRHECAHILTVQLKDYRRGPLGQKHAEAVASDLAAAFGWIREAGQADILEGLAFNG